MNILFPVFCLIAIGSCIGFVFGFMEAEEQFARNHRSGTKKLPHGKLLAGRIVCCLVLSVGTLGWTWFALAGAGIAFLAVTTVHRQCYNFGSKMPFYYMGPAFRSAGDSVYDTFCWKVAQGIAIMVGDRSRFMDPRYRSDYAHWPFYVATITEVVLLVSNIALFKRLA